MTPEQRSLRASTASHAFWARCPNRSAHVLPANRGLEARIAKEYGIPADLPPAEYATRIESARKAYFRSLAAKSAKARARRKQQGSAA